jgi:hypothetical protein
MLMRGSSVDPKVAAARAIYLQEMITKMVCFYQSLEKQATIPMGLTLDQISFVGVNAVVPAKIDAFSG